MAEQTVAKFFLTERSTHSGFDLHGKPKQYDVEQCKTTRRDVQAALEDLGREFPELNDCMRVAAAMLVRLDTIRDEAQWHVAAARRKVVQGDADGALKAIENLKQTLGDREEIHTLYVH